MNQERKKQLRQLVNEKGLKNASKVLGLTRVDLVVMLDIHINYKLANELLFELHMSNKLPEVYREYVISVDRFNGTFEWTLDSKTDYYGDNNEYKEVFSSYATPFWDGSDYTPVEAIFYVLIKDGEKIRDKELMGDYFESLKSITEFKNMKHLLMWYKDFYLPNVYYILNNVFLNDIREESKSTDTI